MLDAGLGLIGAAAISTRHLWLLMIATDRRNSRGGAAIFCCGTAELPIRPARSAATMGPL